MKNHLKRWVLHRRLRALARHLNDLHDQSRALDRSKIHYEREAQQTHAELLSLSLTMRSYRA